MKNAHMKSNAAGSNRATGRALVRPFVLRAAAAGVLGLALITSAMANPGRDQRGGGWQNDPMRQSSMPQRQFDDRQQRQFEERQRRNDDERAFQQQAEEQRRRLYEQQQSQNQESRRSGRLTPDERRDLRRQINEAGADIYQRQRRR